MRIDRADHEVVEITLSRRNVLALLAKVDGHPENSACTVVGPADEPTLWLHVERDDVHYADRPTGPMEQETEDWIRLHGLAPTHVMEIEVTNNVEDYEA